MRIVAWAVLVLAFAQSGLAGERARGSLAERLGGIRSKVLGLQKSLIDGLQSQREAKTNIQKIRTLIRLQREERELSRTRVGELERTISELSSRRALLQERAARHRATIRHALKEIRRSEGRPPPGLFPESAEASEIARRRALANLAAWSAREVKAFLTDLADADQLEARIQEERQQLEFIVEELKEQEGVLELNRQVQVDVLRKRHQERVVQLDNYQRLKDSEAQVEKLIRNFNARLEIERTEETERVVNRSMTRGTFAQLKGKLPLPVAGGNIVARFGRSFDEKSSLYVFRKGVDIAVEKRTPVVAVTAGRIAFAGEMPGYGRVAILDHGDHFYTLCGRMGEISRKAGDGVAAGDAIGLTDATGTPVYFEVRAKNIAVDPLQWMKD